MTEDMKVADVGDNELTQDEMEIKIGDQAQKLTSEEIMAAKKKLFEEDPNRFVDLADIVLAVAKYENNYMTYIRPNANSLDVMYAKGQMAYVADTHMRRLEYLAAKEKKIIAPNGGGNMRTFANKFMKRK